MGRIPYPELSSIEDEGILSILDRARREGTPRPESQAIRAHVPPVLFAFTDAWQKTFVEGVVPHELKELCRVYVTKTVECGYCSAQRSSHADVDESVYDDLLEYESSPLYSDREKAALAYTDAIVWNPDLADDAVWTRLHRWLSDEEIVELGFFIALTSGQQRWIKTLQLAHGEFMSGEAPTKVREPI